MITNGFYAIYFIGYSIRKIKAHLKELDILVTLRFEEYQKFLFITDLKKRDKLAKS